MSEPPEGNRKPVVTIPLVVAGVCLAIPFAAMLWVGSYSRVEPAFIGIPFFYWYQMLWVVISTLLTVVAYTIVRRHERTVRAHRGGEEQ
ncbi:membrane protein implicated in regulation of membrane protease activity [Streptomyces olivoverticillatus]|uniref:Membrane protein implicated in regulation of membrane protease activity n=1 Tax=Streptomyces olivoverticillatus TaxID=66427 RepID=A0A7W7PHS1_9ACTN|nr:DUF3311 domain-containing protein [Streptomyces olivoverticillatus]MBB4891381.1 membrane protein implicated in regulation of membrane protease activity [Streptomyces olivoverticillatus]